MSSSLDKLKNRAAAATLTSEVVRDIPLAKIRFDPTQPRKAFHHLDGRVAISDEEYIAELAESMEANGQIEPITVQEMPDGTYLVVVGECRTRARLLKRWPTIRAVIRNDLTSPGKRLLFQLAENVNRQNLTDHELAGSVRVLMDGSAGVEPMSQVEIAKTLGKSEGWVSRFVKFGDEELQRTWVATGIADTVEKLYRLSILPKAMQVDVQRRVGLPEGHPEHLDKPLLRGVIDQLTHEAKIGKMAAKAAPSGLGAASTIAGVTAPAAAPQASGAGHAPGSEGRDAVGEAFAAAVVGSAPAPAAAPQAGLQVAGKYQLDEASRNAILASAAAIPNVGATGSQVRAVVQPPVNCRVSVGNVAGLLELLQSMPKLLDAVDGVQCELVIPGPLAQVLADQLKGNVVDQREVPAMLQLELGKLHCE